MKLVVISPEDAEPREIAVLGALFAAGLERYHVRKPHWSAEQLGAWLRELPEAWRPRLVLHQHHPFVAELGLGGRHWRDVPQEVGRVIPNPPPQPLRPPEERRVKDNAPYPSFTSRSCHDLATLRTALGRYDSVFIGPVFPSLSKPGHGPRGEFSLQETATLLAQRTPAEHRTVVVALGGITAERLPQLRALGFDGAAVLGALWQAADPVVAFAELQATLRAHAA